MSSAAAARRFVRETLTDWGFDDCEEAATLAVSEVVTNAVLHARSEFDLVVRSTADELRIEVYDASPVLPARKHYGVNAGTGRGMLLIEALTERWGAEPAGSGKVVWFVLRSSGEAEFAFELDADTLADLEELQAGTVQPRAATTRREKAPAEDPTPCA